jgi:hypothetical protein
MPLVSACTSNDEPGTNATIQNYVTEGDNFHQVYLLIVSGAKTPCMKEMFHKSSAELSTTTILLDSTSVADIQPETGFDDLLAASTKSESSSSLYEADLTISQNASGVVAGSYQLTDTSGTPVQAWMKFRARKCPDFSMGGLDD